MDKIYSIAIACQNGRTISQHAGKCSRFLHFQWSESDETWQCVGEINLLPTQIFHGQTWDWQSHPLYRMDALIAKGMGQGLVRRLALVNKLGLVTTLDVPDQAVAAWQAQSGEVAPVELVTKGCYSCQCSHSR